MKTLRVNFENSQGHQLSARLEMPAVKPPEHYAIFAHCFTCGKNIKAATVISRELTQYGFGVLRFDFTGLGQSEGKFEETDFTSNISDLLDAATYLEKNYSSPKLLIGHSLGGTAVLHAARHLKSVEAVATIGAPYQASHVLKLIDNEKEDILDKGKGEVNIGGRSFTIGSKFIQDIHGHDLNSSLPTLRKALLVMHSPQDTTVGINNAAEIYQAAFHPKSFITLDGADHLLTRQEDAAYVAKIISSWVQRYLPLERKTSDESPEDVTVQLGSDGFTTEVIAGRHTFLADEPKDAGGNDMGPDPYQLLNAALGTCTAMTMKMYAERKQWDLKKATVHLSHERLHPEDSSHPEEKKSKIEVFKRTIELEGELTVEQKNKLLEIANKCPVHRTLSESEVTVETELKE